MIVDNTPTSDKAPWRVALEDAIVSFFIAFFSALIATGLNWPPSADVVYASLIPAALIGFVSWGKARNVKVPPGVP